MGEPVTLSQAELDAAYHKAVFDCDQALADTIRRIFKLREQHMASGDDTTWALWKLICEDMHNALSLAFSECEIAHMGKDRYDTLIASLWARKHDEKAKH